MKSYRQLSVEILDRFYNTSLNLKSIQNALFSKNKISGDERNRTLVLTREILRWKGRIDWFIARHLKTPLIKLQPSLLTILELGTYELMFDKKVPNYAAINSAVEIAKTNVNMKASGLVNAVLRKVSNESFELRSTEIHDYDWFSFPKWLFEKWSITFGLENAIELTNYFNSLSKLNIRRNCKIAKSAFGNNLPPEVELEKFENSDLFYTVHKGGSLLKRSDSFKKGDFSFQDRASGMVVEVLDPQPGDVILDVCAAPGTKTNYIAELIGDNGMIYASDLNEKRIESAQHDLKRTGNNSINFEVKDATKSDFPMADKILVDVPCSGTGTIGRRPDIKWRRTPKQIETAIGNQKAILNNVQKFVKPGGVMVYATCSIEPEENWDVVEAFLKLHADFRVISINNQELTEFIDGKGALSIFPPEHKMDGMFAVKMIKDAKKNT